MKGRIRRLLTSQAEGCGDPTSTVISVLLRVIAGVLGRFISKLIICYTQQMAVVALTLGCLGLGRADLNESEKAGSHNAARHTRPQTLLIICTAELAIPL